MIRILSTLALLAAAAPAQAETWLVDLEGMTCGGCERTVTAALEAVEGVASVQASFVAGQVCVDGAVSSEAVTAALASTKYVVANTTAVEACPAALSAKRRPDPWDDITDVDVETISRGDKFKLKDHQVPEHVTIFDFGATWCGPCFVAARTLASYLRSHDDVAVRAVALDGADAKASFETPAARQHLAFAGGLPWLIVVDAKGKRLYEGGDASEAIAAIDAGRSTP